MISSNVNLKIPSTSIHQSGTLIDVDMKKFIVEKIKLFKKEKLYDGSIAEVIGVLMNYETISETEANGCSGYCDSFNKIILVKNDYSISFQRKTMLHELGHAFQYELERYEDRTQLLSSRVEKEWQTESIAYYMYNQLYGQIHHSKFNSYFNEESIIWLNYWYKNSTIVNDVI